MIKRSSPSFVDELPPTRGPQISGAGLSRGTWFGVGGPAEVLFEPQDESDLIAFLKGLPGPVPVTVIGAGSNLLIRDGGIRGIVIRLGRGFSAVEVVDDEELVCGAGALDIAVARAARNVALTGLEFLCGIPGFIGGALRMNAGAYGREIKDVLVSCEAVDRHGERRTLMVKDLSLSYRHCGVPEDWTFLSARLRGSRGERSVIADAMAAIKAQRKDSQPTGRTGGCAFANPPSVSAWKLIDAAGCRGLRVGGAQVSRQHCNFLLNVDGATADDIETLGEIVRQRVLETSGVMLRWEIRRVGERVSAVASGDAA